MGGLNEASDQAFAPLPNSEDEHAPQGYDIVDFLPPLVQLLLAGHGVQLPSVVGVREGGKVLVGDH